MTAIGIGLEWHKEHPRRLSTEVAASHLGLFGSLCRPRCFGTVQPDQRPGSPTLASQDRPLRYPAQDSSPTDPCNKVPDAPSLSGRTPQRPQSKQSGKLSLTSLTRISTQSRSAHHPKRLLAWSARSSP